jgi:hypothetical protein
MYVYIYISFCPKLGYPNIQWFIIFFSNRIYHFGAAKKHHFQTDENQEPRCFLGLLATNNHNIKRL